MSERELKIESWNIERIKPYELNVKIHDDKQVSKIAASIKKFGWQGSPILVDKNGVIVAGHGRRLAAIKLDMKTLPVAVLSDLSEDEVRKSA
jgi:ParB-like chromosome segregation protein Spo0J